MNLTTIKKNKSNWYKVIQIEMLNDMVTSMDKTTISLAPVVNIFINQYT